jgi:hypothetical protein
LNALKTYEIVAIAIEETKNLIPEDTFMVKDLFIGYKWKKISPTMRKDIGRQFLFKIEEFKNLNIEKFNFESRQLTF